MKDLIRDNTPSSVNKSIDEQTLAHLESYKTAGRDRIEQRLRELDQQWDVECYVGLAGAGLSLSGLALGLRNRKFLAVPLLVQGLVALHALPLWDPLTPLFRSFGIWTRQEIERERHALKLLRGDYERVQKDGSAKSALAASQGDVGIKEATGTESAGRTRASGKRTGARGKGKSASRPGSDTSSAGPRNAPDDPGGRTPELNKPGTVPLGEAAHFDRATSTKGADEEPTTFGDEGGGGMPH